MNKHTEGSFSSVEWLKIGPDHAGQRLDNFLFSRLKGVPKSKIYNIVRRGEVRVNKGRVDVGYRLQCNDDIRIPPLRQARREASVLIQPRLKESLLSHILYEDEGLIVLNKPAGFAVHGGSGIHSGVIEALRQLRPEQRYMELVHRLDKETSGCLLVAKKRIVLTRLHELFFGNGITKTYLALLSGRWQRDKQTVDVALQKNVLKSGERFVVVSKQGKLAQTQFTRLQNFSESTLVRAMPKTGRTHQIRVHAAWLGHPIVGDTRYGQDDTNRHFKQKGCNRLFLHAEQLLFVHPLNGEKMHFQAPLASELNVFLEDEETL